MSLCLSAVYFLLLWLFVVGCDAILRSNRHITRTGLLSKDPTDGNTREWTIIFACCWIPLLPCATHYPVPRCGCCSHGCFAKFDLAPALTLVIQLVLPSVYVFYLLCICLDVIITCASCVKLYFKLAGRFSTASTAPLECGHIYLLAMGGPVFMRKLFCLPVARMVTCVFWCVGPMLAKNTNKPTSVGCARAWVDQGKEL